MQTINIPLETFEKIISRLDELTREVKDIKVRLFEHEPAYGSDEWWEWSDKKALESIRRGEGTTVHSQKELQTFLNTLKNA